ncbi:hypothetical protein BHM03_00026683 [Ensete ventricosum]|nr:hypothetical protein BHM03_00026683 [Ensete ventricosum]
MLSHGDDEEKWLVEDIAGIQHNTFYMHHTLVGTQSSYNALTTIPNLHHLLNIVLLRILDADATEAVDLSTLPTQILRAL